MPSWSQAFGSGSKKKTDPVQDYQKWADVVSGYNQTRVPDMQTLEQSSSDQIAGLLNPPAFFADTSRMAAELGSGRGVSGSGAAASTAVRMTDEERLKRIALGSELLSQAAERYPAMQPPGTENFIMTPYQQGTLDLGWQELQNERDKLKATLKSLNSEGKSYRTNTPVGPWQLLNTGPRYMEYFNYG